MTRTTPPTMPGTFLQLIEYRTSQPEKMSEIIDRWVDAIGAERTARWYIATADRDQSDVFVQLVEFPSYDAAMANSGHPATTAFASALTELCSGDPIFRNLDVLDSKPL
jgi:hypothetical protein